MEKVFAILTASFFCLSFLQAQNKNELQIENTVARFIKAMEDSDVKTLSNLTSPKLSYGHSGGKVEDKPQFLHTFESGATDFVKIIVTDQSVSIINNAAIVRHNFEADTKDNNTPGHVKLKVLTVWQKQGGKWVLIARQAVKTPTT